MQDLAPGGPISDSPAPPIWVWTSSFSAYAPRGGTSGYLTFPLRELGTVAGSTPARRVETPGTAVTLSRNYTHRSMARRTRVEYSTTHMMSEAQPRLSSTACSLMVNSPWRRNAMGPPPSHKSACHQTGWTGPWDKPELF